jgi:hypothetical protein
VTHAKRIIWPLAAGLLGSAFLTGLYLGIVSWAQSLDHAVDLFWQERTFTIPLILGFGIQAAIYTVLKKRLFVPVAHTGPSGALTGMSGASSTLAMVACCAHHAVDVLPILGLSAAAAFLAEYQQTLMWVGLGTTMLGIAVMLVILYRERRKVVGFSRCQLPLPGV